MYGEQKMVINVNNKGFVIVETLIASSATLVILMVFYFFSNRIISNYNKNFNYNDAEDTLKLANIRTFIYKNTNNDDINNLLNQLVENKKCISIKNISYKEEENLTNKYESIINDYGVKHLYLCNNNLTIDNANLGDTYYFLKEYINYLKQSEPSLGKYSIYTYNEDKNSYSYINFWEIST